VTVSGPFGVDAERPMQPPVRPSATCMLSANLDGRGQRYPGDRCECVAHQRARRVSSGSVLDRFAAFSVLRAVRATVEASRDLGAVSDDPAAAVLAYRRHCVDGAFEAVEDMSGSSSHHFEALVVVVAADFTGSQFSCPLPH